MNYAIQPTIDERFICREAPALPPSRPRSRLADARPGDRPGERAVFDADALAMSLRAALDRLVIPLARAAATFVKQKAWAQFGFAHLDDHARERFGRSGRTIRNLAALGSALADLPDSSRALLLAVLAGEDGAPPLGREAAIRISRAILRIGVADAAHRLAEWISLGRSLSVRDLVAALACAPARAPAPECDETADRSLVRVPMSAAVLAAFDEALDLFRAVDGTDATVTAFVEALVAESAAADDVAPAAADPGAPAAARPAPAGDDSPDRVALRRGSDIARVEAALDRSSEGWRRLARSSPASWAMALAGSSLSRFVLLARTAGSGGPAEVDAQIRALLALENDLEARLGRLLAAMAERGAWRRLMFAGVGHYAERRLGVSRTTAEDRARAARELPRFPLLQAAYEEGRIGLESALLVVRMIGDRRVDAATERAWVTRAEEATVKRLRDEARALGRRRVVSRGAARDGESPRPLDDAAWHASIRRAPGTASARILFYGRRAAGFGSEAGAPGPPPGPDVFLRLRLPDDLAADFVAAIETARRAVSRRVETIPWDEPWPDPEATPSTLAARACFERGRRIPPWVGVLAMLEDFTVTWDVVAPLRRRPGDAVFVRDGWRCMAPGCTARRHLELHHLVYRSRLGGDHDPNLACICGFHHHQGEHGGLAACRGRAPLDIYWRLGTPALGAWYLNERRLAGPESAEPA